ncbi:MAG TPA: hypothetical protein IAA63_00100 [Candidatus Pullilachnospira stercoravium]|uniref:Uncharacterized protein n=1 Tax=Candidatus Pullilachnospira stercoravium TaxID=2840913 RepID=A0A9D1NRD5_9FIRM|nr:hypothetical protein [Candidatus Pullilachnospira stercoravium]
MNTAITLIIAIVVIILHVWLCRRSPKFWYLGGIIPLLWIALLAFLFFYRKISWGDDWKMVVFPTLIFFLFWIQGYQTAKKKELEKMKAKDIQ